jgi:purine-nucleoside phosphorylase
MGIEVLGISCVTNLAAGLGTTPLSHEEVFEAGRQVESRLAGLLKRLAPRIAASIATNSEAHPRADSNERITGGAASAA